MAEIPSFYQPTPEPHSTPSIESSRDLVVQISELSKPINEFWIARDTGGPRRKLNIDEEVELFSLLQPRNQKIIDLLVARNNNDCPNVTVFLNKGIREVNDFTEKTHPFSDNGIAIYAPSTRTTGEEFTIRTKLSGLRRNGLVENSLDAELLLGEKIETPEEPNHFMYRTYRELSDIARLRYRAAQKDGKQNLYSVDYFDQLSADIIIGRLLELRRKKKIPLGFDVNFYLLRDKKTHKPKLESTEIHLPNWSRRTFVIPGQRIGEALASFGLDYDREELR